MPIQRLSLKVGDLLPSAEIAATFRSGAPIPMADVDAATIRFRMWRPGRATPKIAAATAECSNLDDVVADPTVTPLLRYNWAGGDTDTAGEYWAHFVITYDAKPMHVPNLGHLVISVDPY